MNYRQELERHEEQLIRLNKHMVELETNIRLAQQALLELAETIREAGLPPAGDLPSEP